VGDQLSLTVFGEFESPRFDVLFRCRLEQRMTGNCNNRDGFAIGVQNELHFHFALNLCQACDWRILRKASRPQMRLRDALAKRNRSDEQQDSSNE